MITDPLQYDPAFEAKYKIAPAMSSSLPILSNGTMSFPTPPLSMIGPAIALGYT